MLRPVHKGDLWPRADRDWGSPACKGNLFLVEISTTAAILAHCLPASCALLLHCFLRNCLSLCPLHWLHHQFSALWQQQPLIYARKTTSQAGRQKSPKTEEQKKNWVQFPVVGGASLLPSSNMWSECQGYWVQKNDHNTYICMCLQFIVGWLAATWQNQSIPTW